MRVSIRDARGFSLVELMVVVAIIGILAAIAVPNFQRFTAKSKQSEAKSNLSALYSAERAFQAEWQTFAASFNVVGYAPTGTLRYNHGFAADFATAAGAGLPLNYTGPPSNATFNSTPHCAIVTNGCAVNQIPVAPGGVAGTAMAAPTFLAQARGDVDGDATIDIWTMSEMKALLNPTSDL